LSGSTILPSVYAPTAARQHHGSKL
jgi:hypothetical protein